MSRAALYSCKDKVLDAIIATKELDIILPYSSLEDIQRTARGFASISTNMILTGCVGCIDGWFCVIENPSSNEVPDVSSFFSGHYQVEGLNVQAVCDSRCSFIGFCVKSPGKVSDVSAYSKWELSCIIDGLPNGYYIVGDNAYTLTPHLLVPFTKPELKTQGRSDYNFYISQLRIRVEMASGLLVNKWRIFKRPLRVKFSNIKYIIAACMRLHNYCISERIRGLDDHEQNEILTSDFNLLPECSFERAAHDTVLCDSVRKANSHILREVIVQHIQNYNLARP